MVNPVSLSKVYTGHKFCLRFEKITKLISLNITTSDEKHQHQIHSAKHTTQRRKLCHIVRIIAVEFNTIFKVSYVSQGARMNHNQAVRDLILNTRNHFAKLRRPFLCKNGFLSSLLFSNVIFFSTFTYLLLSSNLSFAATENSESINNPKLKSVSKINDNRDNQKNYNLWSGDFSVDVRNEKTTNVYKETNLTRLSLSSRLQYVPTDYFSLLAAPALKYKSGFQTKDDSPNAGTFNGSKTDLIIKEAAIDLSAPISSEIRTGFLVGAIDQSRFHTSLLMSEKAFPSVIVAVGNLSTKYFTNKKNTLNAATVSHSSLTNGFKLFAQSSVPTSEGLRSETNELESAPSFFSAGLIANYDLLSQLVADLKVSYFQFKNTPVLVSTQSSYWGNTTDSVNATQSRLRYEPTGVEAQLGFDLTITKGWTYQVQAVGVNNQEAPEDMARAYSLRNGLQWQVNKNWAFTPSYKYYRIDSDATISYYLDPAYETNRVGHQLELSLENKNIFKIGLELREETVLKESFYQSKNQIYMLKLESGYAQF